MKLHYKSSKRQVTEVRNIELLEAYSAERFNYYGPMRFVRHNIFFVMHNQFAGLRHGLSVLLNKDDSPTQFFWGIGRV
jgi:hypothetical protein